MAKDLIILVCLISLLIFGCITPTQTTQSAVIPNETVQVTNQTQTTTAFTTAEDYFRHIKETDNTEVLCPPHDPYTELLVANLTMEGISPVYWLIIPPESVFSGFPRSNVNNNGSVIPCLPAWGAGQNINYIYCTDATIALTNKAVDTNGTILGSVTLLVRPVFDVRNATKEPAVVPNIGYLQNIAKSSNDTVLYKLSGFSLVRDRCTGKYRLQ